jgi:hypothetical protein
VQVLPHTLLTSPTQMLSQLFVQQNESTAQICATQSAPPTSQPEVSAAPAVHGACAQVPAHVLLPHTDDTSLTQMLSQPVLQQYASTAQICAVQLLQLLINGVPCVQTLWLQPQFGSAPSVKPSQSSSSPLLQFSVVAMLF